MNYISVKVCDELYALMAQEADADGVALIDVAVRAIAKHFKRPDLGTVPRKRFGKRTKEPVKAAS